MNLFWKLLLSQTNFGFGSKYCFRKCHELITFKKDSLIKWHFYSLSSSSKQFSGRASTFSVLLTSNHTECKILKFRRAELQNQPLKTKSILHIVASCIEVHLQVWNRTYSLKLDTSSGRAIGHSKLHNYCIPSCQIHIKI